MRVELNAWEVPSLTVGTCGSPQVPGEGNGRRRLPPCGHPHRPGQSSQHTAILTCQGGEVRGSNRPFLVTYKNYLQWTVNYFFISIYLVYIFWIVIISLFRLYIPFIFFVIYFAKCFIIFYLTLWLPRYSFAGLVSGTTKCFDTQTSSTHIKQQLCEIPI